MYIREIDKTNLDAKRLHGTAVTLSKTFQFSARVISFPLWSVPILHSFSKTRYKRSLFLSLFEKSSFMTQFN